jgi:cell division septum initiation protein DivIVA
MSVRNIINLLALAALATFNLMPTTATAAPQRLGARPPTVLWRNFPLRPPAATTDRPRTTPTREKVQSPRQSPRHSDSTSQERTWLWIVLGIALTSCVAAAVVVTFLSQVLNQGGVMDRFLSRKHGARKHEEERREGPAAEEKGDTAARVTSYLGTGSTLDSPPEISHRPRTADLNRAPDLNRVVGHVGSVLQAAEEAAARIQEEARQDAERVLGEAQQEASERADAARKHASSSRAEAERLRSEAEEWIAQTRDATERDAADRRADAESEARSILSAAERQVEALGKETERRQQALRTDISLAEDRLRQLVSGLREVAVRLDMLLSTSSDRQDDADLAIEREDALMEAITPPREREEATK